MKSGMIGSMSLPANPYHNAQTESFMETLESEEVYLPRSEAFKDVATSLTGSIKDVYNARRLHSPPDY